MCVNNKMKGFGVSDSMPKMILTLLCDQLSVDAADSSPQCVRMENAWRVCPTGIPSVDAIMMYDAIDVLLPTLSPYIF